MIEKVQKIKTNLEIYDQVVYERLQIAIYGPKTYKKMVDKGERMITSLFYKLKHLMHLISSAPSRNFCQLFQDIFSWLPNLDQQLSSVRLGEISWPLFNQFYKQFRSRLWRAPNFSFKDWKVILNLYWTSLVFGQFHQLF